MPALEAWFLGGPVDGRVAFVEIDDAGSLPPALVLLQSGAYIGSDIQPASTVEHHYVRENSEADPPIYLYVGPTGG
ncbi:hypothetical protein ACFWRG_19965 [Micromonospora tulbaghiae]|uniref:hypothetical protein n=1 Tax=Micromonospora tulbaghiae TaxID=479978 RepID=UPI0036630952